MQQRGVWRTFSPILGGYVDVLPSMTGGVFFSSFSLCLAFFFVAFSFFVTRGNEHWQVVCHLHS